LLWVEKMGYIIDQRDIQKLGGKASKYPSSYIVYSILNKHGLYDNVLDVTYGRGRFYYYKKPKFLVAADPKVWEWIVKPDIFIPRPVWALKPILQNIKLTFDVIVCDPPQWKKNTSYSRRDEYSYAIGSATLIINETIKLANQLGIEHMLLHYDKLLDNAIVVEDILFRYVARYLNNPELRATHFTLYRISR